MKGSGSVSQVKEALERYMTAQQTSRSVLDELNETVWFTKH